MESYERKNRIDEALYIRNMKQVELIEKTGLTKSSVSSWIAQRWQPKQKAIHRMAQVLDVNEMWLAGYDVPMERTKAQVKMETLAQLIQRLRTDDRLTTLTLAISELSDEQLTAIEVVVAELNRTKQ